MIYKAHALNYLQKCGIILNKEVTAMGKQFNYIMDYESLKQLAQYALDLGCMIIPHDFTKTPAAPSYDLSKVVPNHNRYCFYIPDLFPQDQISPRCSLQR